VAESLQARMIELIKSHLPSMAETEAGVADYGDNGHSDSGFLISRKPRLFFAETPRPSSQLRDAGLPALDYVFVVTVVGR